MIRPPETMLPRDIHPGMLFLPGPDGLSMALSMNAQDSAPPPHRGVATGTTLPLSRSIRCMLSISARSLSVSPGRMATLA